MSCSIWRRLYAWCKADKNRCIKYGVLLAVFVTGVVLLVTDYRTAVSELSDGLKRNTYGEGTRTEELDVKVEDLSKNEIEIEISEQMYEKEDIEVLFQRCIQRIETEMLGENESLDCVVTDLNLMTELEGEPIEISWTQDRYDVMNIYGEIQKDATVAEGTLVNLSAVLTYTQEQERQTVFECAVMIYPEPLTEEEELAARVQSEIRKEDERTQTEEILSLPESVDGKSVRYYRKMEDRGIVLILMAVILGILFYAQEIQNQGEQIKKRRQQMLRDYPEILNKLTLFSGAGMTMKRAFRKVVGDYEEGKKILGTRYVYEEMKIACREMESGITEAESYERFGRRCNMQEYIRLGALLSQNMRKGTSGLNHILRLEAIQAFENRKAQAKKLGEEAGTKLLIPMFIMLMVVLVMVIVPAFLNMQV